MACLRLILTTLTTEAYGRAKLERPCLLKASDVEGTPTISFRCCLLVSSLQQQQLAFDTVSFRIRTTITRLV